MKKVRNMEVPSTVTELRDDMLTMYTEIGHGQIKLDMAKEKSNACGKISKTVALQLEYAGMCKVKPKIPFLE